MGDAERKEDKPLQLICVADFEKYTRVRGCYPWLADKISKIEKRDSVKPPKPAAAWRAPFWRLVCHPSFDTLFLLLVLLNLIPVLWEVIETFTSKHLTCKEQAESVKFKAFLYANMVFTILFSIEFILNVRRALISKS